jgi:2-(1,2-epoxy-1,2-dihydrophenyl)acetyl-CoA isomerase
MAATNATTAGANPGDATAADATAGDAEAAAAGATMARPTVRFDVANAVATITLDRPDALNALTVPMKRELLAALRTVGRDRGVRAVILTGAGRAFCAGQDLKERLEPDAAPLGVEVRERYNPIIQAMRALPKPIIGAINGVAAGAGASLALACDLRIVAEGATIALAFGRVGLVPDSGATWLLPRLVGAAKASEIALLGEALPADEIVRLGLAVRVVPAGSLLEDAGAMAARLAASAPRALALTKQALNAAWDRALDAALEYEAHLQDLAGRSADHAEGLEAFMARRPPRFTGE